MPMQPAVCMFFILNCHAQPVSRTRVLNGQKLLSLTEKYCLIQQDRRFCRDKSGHCVTVRWMETGTFPSLIPM